MMDNKRDKAADVPIFALPDDVVVARLLPGRFDALVDDAGALSRIRATPGLVPAAIAPGTGAPEDGRIYWVDIGQHPYRDWQHLFTIERLARENRIKSAFASSLRVLDEPELIPDALSPSGFIFHTSRCGSTLLGKALARPREHIVVNQGGPLQRGFWAAHNADFAGPLTDNAATHRRFRNLVYALTRPRLGCENHSFVKFISWNTLYIDFISKAFADVPALFLFRDPVEVIASVMKETTAVLVAKNRPQACFLTGKPMAQVQHMSDAVYLAHCYNNYFGVVLNSSIKRLKALDYYNLNPGTLERILWSGFGFSPGSRALAQMCTQFAFHAKDDTDTSTFTSDGARKRSAIASEDIKRIEEITAARLAHLRAAPRSLFGTAACGPAQGGQIKDGQIKDGLSS